MTVDDRVILAAAHGLRDDLAVRWPDYEYVVVDRTREPRPTAVVEVRKSVRVLQRTNGGRSYTVPVGICFNHAIVTVRHGSEATPGAQTVFEWADPELISRIIWCIHRAITKP